MDQSILLIGFLVAIAVAFAAWYRRGPEPLFNHKVAAGVFATIATIFVVAMMAGW